MRYCNPSAPVVRRSGSSLSADVVTMTPSKLSHRN